MPRSSYIAAIAIVLLASTAAADPGRPAPDDEIPPPPPTYKANSVNVEERLGARVPTDTRFRTADGATTTLGDVLRGELPAILTFNYSDCPMLCNLQLNGFVAALPGVELGIGAQFRIVTISLDPNESPERMARMRDRYLARLPEAQREAARRGWTFLVAESPKSDAIRRVAEAVGFTYVYIEERGEWAHPAALIFLSTAGAVTRYVHGIEFDPAMLRESIFKAGLAEPATAVGFLNRCYHYDPAASDKSALGVAALRLGAAGCVVLLLAGLGTLHLARRARARSLPHPRSMTQEGNVP